MHARAQKDVAGHDRAGHGGERQQRGRSAAQGRSGGLRLLLQLQQPADAMRVVPLESAKLVLADGDVYPERGRLLFVDRAVDPQTGTLRADLTFPNPKRILRPGLYGKLRYREEVRKDALLVPHHGSATSSTPEFVKQVAPRHAVFAVGHRNRFGHPREDVIERYREAGSELLRTDTGGAIQLRFAPGGLRVYAERDRARRYWHEL